MPTHGVTPSLEEWGFKRAMALGQSNLLGLYQGLIKQRRPGKDTRQVAEERNTAAGDEEALWATSSGISWRVLRLDNTEPVRLGPLATSSSSTANQSRDRLGIEDHLHPCYLGRSSGVCGYLHVILNLAVIEVYVLFME